MSYSRWSRESRWYTFWSASGSTDTQYKWPTKNLKRSQIFEICDMPSYRITYGDLVDRSRSSVLHEIEEHFAKDFEWNDLEFVDGKLEPGETTIIKGRRPTWEELHQLQDYIARFIRDVDNHFQTWEFFKYEWIIPIYHKIYRKIKKIIWKHL